MDDFSRGKQIQMEAGDSAEVLSVLGSGGQGTVYKVRYAGGEYALKWYQYDKINNPGVFKRNLEKNTLTGPPNDSFLWPLFLSKEQDGSFGYLMKLKPNGYSDFSDILNRKVSLSLYATVDCALNIVNGFGALHRKGYSYQDINDGNFFVDASNGDILICDNDNAAPDGDNLGIGGKPGYMAPEVVCGTSKPETLTDYHSLGVVLFKLLLRHDPLMGQNYVNSVCITEEKERELYGTNPIFIFDPQNKSNQPVPGIHVNPIKLWPLYPTYIQEAFIKTFVEGIKDPNRRITEHQWQKLLICLRSEIITCPCGRELFISKSAPENNTFICPGCGNRNSYPMRLNLNGYPVYLFPKSKVYKCHTEKDSRDYQTLTGEVVQNKSNPSIWGIKNHSADVWLITMPDGTSKSIPNGSVAPIVLGAGIAFNQVNSKIETGGCN